MIINFFDVAIILMFLLFLVVGWKNGVIKELFSFLGIILVFILSFWLKGLVGNIFCTILPFFEFGGYIKGVVSLNILIYHTIAFILLFCLFLGLYRLILKASGFLQKIVNYTIILTIPSKILGAIVGLIEGWIIVFAMLVVLIVPFKDIKEYKDSNMVNKVLFNTPILSNTTKPFVKSISEIYDLTSKISMEELEMNDANLKSIDVMLKYKVVDKYTVKKLMDNDKLSDVKGLDNVLNKYK